MGKYSKSKNQQKRFAPKVHIKAGDMVYVISGAYKSLDQTHKVLQVLPAQNRAIVEGINVRKKHMKPTDTNPGGIIEQEGTIHISNLMLVDPKTKEPTRVARKLVDGEWTRCSVKSGEII